MTTPAFYRLKQIIGDPKAGIDPIVPVSQATWFRGVKEGRYPQGVWLSPNCRAWKAEDIRTLADRLTLEGGK